MCIIKKIYAFVIFDITPKTVFSRLHRLINDV